MDQSPAGGKNRTWPPQWLEIHGNPYEILTREPAPSQPSCWLLQHQASHEVKGNTACHIWTSTLVQTSSNFPKSAKTLSGPSWGQTSRCASSDARHGNHTEASCGCRQQHAQLARSSSRSPLFVLAMWLQSNSPLKHSQNTTQQANMPTWQLPKQCEPTLLDPPRLHVLPNHAKSSVHSRWAWSFAAFAALRAAPVLLRRWPCLSCDWFRRGVSLNFVNYKWSEPYHGRRGCHGYHGYHETWILDKVHGRSCSRQLGSQMGLCQQHELHSQLPAPSGAYWDTFGHSPVWKNQHPSDSKCMGAWVSPGWSRLGKCHTRPAPCCRPTRTHLPGGWGLRALQTPSNKSNTLRPAFTSKPSPLIRTHYSSSSGCGQRTWNSLLQIPQTHKPRQL